MKIKLSQLRSIIREEVAKTYSQYNKEGWPKCEKPGCRGRMKPTLTGRKTSLFCGICGAEKKRGLELETILREENTTTTFECRLCGDTIQGEASPEGPGKAGWSSLAGIDGPSSVCPECAKRVRQDPSELDDFRDEYPNVRLAENLRKEVAGERIELLISQARDEFTDMMGGGSYYEDSGWPSEDEDPNCTLSQFDNVEEATSQGQSTIDELNETDDPHVPLYRALVFRVGPRGKRVLVKELK